jgi:hypothetical protein
MAMRPQAPQVAVPQEIQARALSQSVASDDFCRGLKLKPGINETKVSQDQRHSTSINSHHQALRANFHQFPKHWSLDVTGCHWMSLGQSAKNVGSDVSARLDDDARHALQEVSPEAELKRRDLKRFEALEL